MEYIKKVKDILKFDVSDQLLISLIFEMTRKKDKDFVKELQRVQKENNTVFNTVMRNKIRKFFYFKDHLIENKDLQGLNIRPFTYTNEELEEVFTDFYHRLHNYDPEKIINSLTTNINNLKKGNEMGQFADKWLNYYNDKYSNVDFSLIVYKVDQSEFKKKDFNIDFVNDFIYSTYKNLINYRYLAIVFEDELIDQNEVNKTWSIIYKAGIYAENFNKYEEAFVPFKREDLQAKLTLFLQSRGVSKSEDTAEKFYSSMSYGYKFEDLYISDNAKTKILILKKIELDNENVPCPSCFTTKQRGNSYPEVFLRSWECTNPSCLDRSKSGRGKRFDEFGTYRYFKLMKNNKSDRIDNNMYHDWRRDIFDNRLDWRNYIIKNYSYYGETVLAKNVQIFNNHGRKIVNEYNSYNKNEPLKFVELPIYKLFFNIFENKEKSIPGDRMLSKPIEIVNDDSSSFLNTLHPNQIGAAITSPPYYNAREYSQWENLILYLIDMMINASAVFNSLVEGSHYLYNIGDIVAEDNVYVVSLMSNKRIQLGFLSCMVFEIVGFNLSGNIVWDKGQVQSKRNSTVNLFSGYVKCINSYEHILVFKKGEVTYNYNKIIKINPVIKINSKGENTYKHTAPYPLGLVETIKGFANKNLYILDPYLGSGTTLKWALKNDFKGLGIELNEEYFKLAQKKVFEDDN